MTVFPLVQEIPYQNPIDRVSAFSAKSGLVFLESAQLREGCGRYSFIGVDPFFILQSKNHSSDPFVELSEKLNEFSLTLHEGLPPFQGGVMGFFSYDLCHHLEKIPRMKKDDMHFADLIVGFYDLVMAFDHLEKRAFIFSSGFPLKKKSEREAHAKKRMQEILSQLKNISAPNISKKKCDEKNIYSNFSAEAYQHAVQVVKNYILSGDIFEANISQRFQIHLPQDLSGFELYQRLREINPAPFSAYLHFGETEIASASPERFLKLQNNFVESRPIKGTRPRGKNNEEDKKLAEELLQSKKDRAENVMIVDLLRNDLSRVCEDHSVEVPQLCGLESYATVHHLVSVITGKLREKWNAIDLLRATFPGGSITGAPKIRAMEIIAEIEPTQRGPYCGSIGYIGFNGDMDLSITIRTFAIKNNIATFQAGGAVVMDSDPKIEYEETLTKAKALRKVLIDDFVN